MNKTTCLIIDDNKNSRSLIRSILQNEFLNLDLNHEASNCREAVKINNSLKPDLVFLDVELGAENGFDFLELTTHRDFKIIFISAFESFAIKAFKVNAVDYILKPFDKEELVNAVHKSLNHPYYTDMKNSIRLLVQSVNGQTNRIAIPMQHGIEFFDVKELIRCESNGNYTTFFFKERKPLTVSKTLGTYEVQLDKKGFSRIHASHIVNLREIRTYHRGNGGYVIMTDGTRVEISKSKKEEFLKRISFYTFEML